MVSSTESGGIKFQGRIPYPIPEGVDDFGYSAYDQEGKVEQFREQLAEKNAWDKDAHDYYTLLRFLKARNYDIPKAMQMWLDHMEWRKQFGVDSLLQEFEFHEREQFLFAWPQGYHKTDKMGRPVYIQLLGKINLEQLKNVTTEDRMIKFHVQEYERCLTQILPVCSHIQGRHIDQTFGILDVKGVGLSHLTGEVKRLLGVILKLDQDNYPESLGHICIINAPAIFRAIWTFVKPMLNVRTQGKIQICSRDYTKELLEWIDEENLPSWLGGKSQGTLIDDVGPWRDPKYADVIRANAKECGIAMKVAAGVATKEANKIRTGRTDMYQSSGNSSPIPVPSQPDTYLTPIDTDNDRGAEYRVEDDVTTQKTPTTLPPLVSRGQHHTASHHENHQLTHIRLVHPSGPSSSHSMSPSAASMKSRSLLERVKALERALPDQVDRLKPYLPPDPNVSMTMSTKSARSAAPEGSLLYRIETLEEALEALLIAQETVWRKQTEAAPTQPEPQPAARSSCCASCSVM